MVAAGIFSPLQKLAQVLPRLLPLLRGLGLVGPRRELDLLRGGELRPAVPAEGVRDEDARATPAAAPLGRGVLGRGGRRSGGWKGRGQGWRANRRDRRFSRGSAWRSLDGWGLRLWRSASARGEDGGALRAGRLRLGDLRAAHRTDEATEDDPALAEPEVPVRDEVPGAVRIEEQVPVRVDVQLAV